jgi:maltooligosyltrehalose trehalohydrolase
MGKGHALERSWGAELLSGGGARFRLWAPALDSVSLVAAAGGGAQAMSKSGDGWFELSTDRIGIGESYVFQLAHGTRVPDPAARAQMGDVHGPSRLVDPEAYNWSTVDWRGRRWEEAIIYELHPGTFTEEGTFGGVESKLDDLVKLGVTVVELMPIAQFAGNRGWGYDGVLLYAPHIAYGTPEQLKHLVDATHQRGLMIFLDVVYNHFGPDGNYLPIYAPDFFHLERHTPWGAAIAYGRAAVRAFFVENALYWIEEYRFDGLRLDAIDQIQDDSQPSILEEIVIALRERTKDRHVHLTTEDDCNRVDLYERANGRPRLYTSEWNDDFHHTAHVIATGESDGYYCDYTESSVAKLARALAEGFVYQGEPSIFRDGASRGEPSGALPPSAFIDFLQNHDQVGNRAFGERLACLADAQAIDALTAILLLSPHIPLLFMGEEWGETRPFCFFTDFHGELGRLVREGRRNEFRKWQSFADPKTRERIPDPQALSTFESSKLDWNEANESLHLQRLHRVRRLIEIRLREIAPRLASGKGNTGDVLIANQCGFSVNWHLGQSELTMVANLHDEPWLVPATVAERTCAAGRLLWETAVGCDAGLQSGTLFPWSVVVRIGDARLEQGQ